MKKKAVILGATGATGKDLVRLIVEDPYYEKIQLIARKELDIPFDHVSLIKTDFKSFDKIQEKLSGDILFICFGTTLNQAGSKEKQWRIDYEIPLKIAEIARIKGFETLVLVSSTGANSNSKIFYSRMKGALDDAILKLGFEKTIIFKPGALIRKNSDRFLENLGVSIINSLNQIGLFKKYKPLKTETLALKMKEAPKYTEIGATFYELDEIHTLF